MKIQTTSFSLKLFAFAAMLLDHIGYAILPEYQIPYYIFRIIGRLAMPIFCYCIAEGYTKTKNRRNYLLRLIACALVSEIPFNLLTDGKLIVIGSMNVMFTFVIALASLMLKDFFSDARPAIIQYLPIVSACLAAELLGTDYGAFGVLLVALFALSPKGQLEKLFTSVALLIFSTRELTIFIVKKLGYVILPSIFSNPNLYIFDLIQIFSLLALIPILFYRGKWGPEFKSEKIKTAVKYSMYLFYPAHMLILYFL